MGVAETILAISAIIGPVSAVLAARILEQRRRANDAKLEVYRVLMKTRQTRLLEEHAGALNIIQVVFYGVDQVMQAHKKYIENLAEPYPEDSDFDTRFTFDKRRYNLYIELMYEIGQHLGFKIDRAHLAELSYSPQAWGNEEAYSRQMRHFLLELAEGRKSLPVSFAPTNSPSSKQLFPPAPNE